MPMLACVGVMEYKNPANVFHQRAESEFGAPPKKLVGAVRFELTTSWTRTTRASQATLRPEPGA